MNNNYIKIVVLGAISGGGTTNIVNILNGGIFNPEAPSSCGASYIGKKIKIDQQEYNLDIWDAGGGQEKYRSLKKLFIKDSDIIILVHDLEYNKDSLDGINYWYKTIKEEILFTNEPIICIFANKIDLIDHKNNDIELSNFAESKGIKLKYVSAKTNSQMILYYTMELVLDYFKYSHITTIYYSEFGELKLGKEELLSSNNNEKEYVKILSKYYNY